MRIAFLSFYSGQIDRGVEVATNELVKRLKRYHQVTLFQAGKKHFQDINTKIISIEVKWSHNSSHNWLNKLYFDYYNRKIFQFTWKFIPYFLKEKFDIVIPTNGGWQVVLCRLLTWVWGKKMVVQGNAGIGRDDWWQMLWWPDVYIAISPAGFTWAKNKFPWVKKVYIPYGVDNQLLRGVKTARLNLAKPIVLCVSALLPYKRVELLVRAMQKIQHASLLIIGQGPLKSEIQTLGQRLLGKRFLLLSDIDHNKLLNFYKTADIFSLPSASSEALGMVYLEAMAAGLPVVATDDVNRRQIIGNAGILVDPENVDNYTQALIQALNTDFKDKPIRQAAKFDWSIIINKYGELLTSL